MSVRMREDPNSYFVVASAKAFSRFVTSGDSALLQSAAAHHAPQILIARPAVRVVNRENVFRRTAHDHEHDIGLIGS